MECINDLISPPTLSLLIVTLGIIGAVYITVYLSLVVPFKIGTNEELLYGKKYFNVTYGIISVFLPFLSLLYIIIVNRKLINPLLLGIHCILGSVACLLLRVLVGLFEC